ncbi:MAG TPA: glycosyltransferase family 4 protein [Planctomycetota bacterium]|nr:glycosyltransferase family 4 protein [Planctomycetota bacterium]
MNVIHLITGRGPTGPAAAAMLDVKALRAAGHNAWICSRSGSGLDDACKAEDIPYIGGVKLGRGALRLFGLPADVRKLREILREFRADVIHVHRSDDQLTAGAALGRTATTKLYRTWHRDPRSLPRPLLARLASHAEGCLGVARAYAEALDKAGARASTFLHAAVDVDVFTPDRRQQWAQAARGFFEKDAALPADSTFVAGHVGRWKRDKHGRDRGQLAALQIFARAHESELSGPRKNAAWQGWVVGRGEMAADLRREAFERLLLPPSRVRLIEAAEHAPAAFAALLSRIDLGLVFVPGSDGTSRAAVEMLACGVPLLVADLPGLRELAEKTECARCLPVDRPEEWSEALQQFLKMPAEQREKLRRGARDRAEAQHSLKARGEALAEFYR